MALEVVVPAGSSVGEIVDVCQGAVFARLGASQSIDGRALVRIPVEDALLTFTARISRPPASVDAPTRIDSFASISVEERRSAERLHEPVRVRICHDSDDRPNRVLPALNVSSKGVLIGWPGRPDLVLGERVDLVLTLSGIDYPVTGDVIRVDEEQSAIQFADIPVATRDSIVSYVFRRDRERKLVDDPYLDVEEGKQE